MRSWVRFVLSKRHLPFVHGTRESPKPAPCPPLYTLINSTHSGPGRTGSDPGAVNIRKRKGVFAG
jgi:hypothetical protein